jgi:hypothetical protein
MASGISYTTILGTAGTVGTTLTLITLWVWKRTTKLDGKEEKRIKELSENEIRRASEELSGLFIEIEGELGRYRTRREDLQTILYDKFVDGQATGLLKNHEEVGKSLDLYNRHKEEYENAYGYFGYATMLIAFDIFLFVAFFLDVLSLGERSFQPWALIPALSAIPLVVFGINSIRNARTLKKKFNERWQEYRYD